MLTYLFCLGLAAFPVHSIQDVPEREAIAESKRFLERVVGPIEATGINVQYLSTQPTVMVLNVSDERTEYHVKFKAQLVAKNASAGAILQKTNIDGIQEINSIIYFRDGVPIHDSLYVGFELMHIEEQQWQNFKETMPKVASRHEEFTRWVVAARKSYGQQLATRYNLQPIEHLRVEGVKFHAFGSLSEKTLQLHRISLKDGFDVYTSDRNEIEAHRADDHEIEPLNAYLSTAPQEETTELFRFSISLPSGKANCFLTAFEAERRKVASRDSTTAIPTNAFVFAHDFAPEPGDNIIPVWSFYNEATGKHFYTESGSIRLGLVQAIESR